MAGYALGAGEGPTYRWWGADFTVKVAERCTSAGLAALQYRTEKGMEPPDHVHDSEDEVVLVLRGSVNFRCGEDHFEVSDGGVVFLPQGVEHGYTIRSDGPVDLVVLTAPPRPAGTPEWAGFVGRVETGELRPTNGFDPADNSQPIGGARADAPDQPSESSRR